MNNASRTWAAIVPARLDSPEARRNLDAVLDGLAAAAADEVWVIEQRAAGADPHVLRDGVRHVVVESRREAFERSRLVIFVLPRLESEWVVVLEPDLLLPFDVLGRSMRCAPNVALRVLSRLETHTRSRGSTVREAPFGKAAIAVEREVFLAIGGFSEAFVGAADEGFELVRRLKRFFSDFAELDLDGTKLLSPQREVDRAARPDNKLLLERCAACIEADVDGYLRDHFESSIPVELEHLRGLSRQRGRRAAFRASSPTPPPRFPAKLRGTMWGVTALFNPAGYRTKRDNFRLFRAGLARAGLPLLAVELAYGDTPFELQPGDADEVVRIRGGDVLWQKERLLNVGVGALPDDCDKVVWLDADVLFERNDWARRTADLLEEHVIVQPFSRSIRLLEGELRADGESMPVGSGEHEILHGMAYGVAAKGYGSLGRYLEHGHCGYAWAARREVVQAHGLYDANVLGNGDLNIAHAMFGGARYLRAERLGHHARAHLERWAEGFFASVRGSVTHLDGMLFHLFHGKKEDRRYVDRLAVLVEQAFDPEHDLEVGAEGAWCWASTKPELARVCAEYFVRRREDGLGPTPDRHAGSQR